jgi:hypothetical protein
MRRLLVLGILVGLSGQPAPQPDRVPVVVELFTSEGCSSCPPADALLSRLAKEQPIAGVRVIPLGMHVTYWDQLGWKDPASLPLATRRQQDYAVVMGGDRVYTPQAVIDGEDEVVGSDEAALTRAIAKAGKRYHLPITITASLESDGIYATVSVDSLPADQLDTIRGTQEPIRTILIITEDELTTSVKRGENRGRTLSHHAVVRRVVMQGEPLGNVAKSWRRDRLNLTVIAQGKRTRHIYASATVPLK